jgi:hypothetical protein
MLSGTGLDVGVALVPTRWRCQHHQRRGRRGEGSDGGSEAKNSGESELHCVDLDLNERRLGDWFFLFFVEREDWTQKRR